MQMDCKEKQPVIRISGVKKKYRLGEYNAESFQEELKNWIETKKAKARGESSDRDRTSQHTMYALNGVDLNVYPGERLGIIGKNGAGKSTLLKLLSRVTAPSEGKIQIWGNVASMLEVGVGFHGEMTGLENIYLNAAIHGMSKEAIERKIDDIIEFSGLREFINTPVKRYSSGMYVKLGFAVAAFLDCEIMVMDEILAVGDMEFQHKCLDRMRSASVEEGRTILFVSHNMNSIQNLCSRCIVMDEGRIIFDGDVQKAISIYLGITEQSGTRTVFNEAHRPYDKTLRINKRLNLDWLEIMDDSSVFESGDKAEIQLCCTAEKELKRVGFRFELWAQDGTKLGTMLSENFADLQKGENLMRIRMDLTHLPFGQYRADLVAYLFDGDGNEDILDGVYPGIIFTVTTPLSDKNYLDWHHNYWGNVRLHDLIINRQE